MSRPEPLEPSSKGTPSGDYEMFRFLVCVVIVVILFFMGLVSIPGGGKW